jgi:uncharacterized membrane protein/nitrite reductase/ring-hydroxylating ferredoxin subunit
MRVERVECEALHMRSRAHIKAHPLHPALVPFPFAFLTGALLFDALGLLRRDGSLMTTGAYLTLAGIAAGLLAAVPGLIDYVYAVPPESSGKARALRHAAGNVIALALFAVAFTLRAGDWTATPGALLLELAGTGALAYSGLLGGTLVTRNLISVDHRYAQAGKWQDVEIAARGTGPVVVGHVDDLKENQMKLLRVNGRRLVLARTADGYCVFDDRCTHRGGSLAAGVLICGTVQCLWHGSQFDVRSGRVACGPAQAPIRTFAVREQNGKLLLDAPPG